MPPIQLVRKKPCIAFIPGAVSICSLLRGNLFNFWLMLQTLCSCLTFWPGCILQARLCCKVCTHAAVCSCSLTAAERVFIERLTFTAELPSPSAELPWRVGEEEVVLRRDLRPSHLIFSIDY